MTENNLPDPRPPSIQTQLEHKFMFSGIDFFTEGQRLFRLVYILLVIQITLIVLCILLTAFFTLTSFGALAMSIRALIKAISDFMP